jgi:signal transduction histidine kinase/DNA-binding response OmpR family regulator
MDQDFLSQRDGADFLAGGGDMSELIRSKDWSRTPLGPIEQWPQSLRTTVSLCLASNFPINIIWGPEHTQIYNQGYRVVCGDVHPVALGQDYSVTWASAWPAIGEPFARAMAGETSYIENQRMFLTRNGYLEETFFTFSHSPIRDEGGGIGGLFHPVTETTPTMLAERRTRALRDLTASLANADDIAGLATLAIETLAPFEYDLPFLLVYALDEAVGTYRLLGHHGVAPASTVSPVALAVDATAPWPMVDAVRSPGVVELGGVSTQFRGIACGPYDEPPGSAFVLPIGLHGAALPPLIVIAGASPRLPLDDIYRAFFELIAAALSAALAMVRAREDERRRVEALAAIDRAKTVFFSNVSHEFRTPLTLMLGPLEDALAAHTMPAHQREQLDVAHRNALRLLKLVNALLDFARIEAGRVQARFEPVDLAELTASLASNFRSACERASLAFRVECPPLSRPIHVDRDMWEKIVLNLISNAFKFTLQGEIAVTLHETDAGAELVVRDTGVGISPEELPRVFERFHRVEGQRGRTQEGTGIGLALVQELIELHGGAITAESSEGIGTAFRVTLRAGTEHLPAEHLASADALAPTATRADAFVGEALRWLPGGGDAPIRREDGESALADIEGRPRVILADDNADMRAYVQGILEAGGYTVEAVENGERALAAARRAPRPDLILSDVMMPVLNGFELLTAVRADPDLAGLLVILLSARAGEEAKAEGLAAGADDYLVKPFSARELRARVDGAVRLGRQRNEAAARERELHAALATERSRAELDAAEQQLAVEREVNRVLDARVAERTARLTESNARMHLLEQITRAIAQRQDVSSILQVVASAIEDRLPADFVCIGRHDRAKASLVIAHVGARSTALGAALEMVPAAEIPIDQNGLARCTADVLVYEPDLAEVAFPFPSRLATQGLRALVLAPLPREQDVFGILVVARRDPHSFASTDCEFLRHLGEHVGLAIEQAQLRDSLRRAYDDLKHTQQAVVEQERLRAIGQMASGIAHDINNAISPVAVYTQSLLERDLVLAPEIRDYLEIVGRVTKDIAATVARMRDFYRPDDGRVEFKPVDLNALVPQVVDLTRARWSDMPLQRGAVIKVMTQLETDLPAVLGNASELREVATNLIFNAVDAMPGGGTLTVRTETLPQEANGERIVRFEVGDSGVGMDEETRLRCLEPFFTTKGERGTGLGLAMVQAAAQRHRARLDIDSAPGLGARFRLDFAAAEAAMSSSEAAAAPRKVRALRLLLVDDDPSVLKSTAFVLKLAGHAITVAAGGEPGVEALQAACASGATFDAIVTDLGMPYIDGNRVAEVAKELFPALPVILLTGWGRRMESGDDAPPHVDFVLPKPLDLTQLREVLAQL